jgi:hypothetical protein
MARVYLVLVGGVDEVAARVGELAQNPVALLLVGPEAPGVAEAHRARHSSETRSPLGPSNW